MTFQELCDFLDMRFESIKRQAQYRHDSVDFTRGKLDECYTWYRTLKVYYIEGAMCTPVYINDTNFETILDNCELVEVVHFRDYDVPIYLDDAGQQYVSYFNDAWYSGGSFNPAGVEEILHQIDDELWYQKREDFLNELETTNNTV